MSVKKLKFLMISSMLVSEWFIPTKPKAIFYDAQVSAICTKTRQGTKTRQVGTLEVRHGERDVGKSRWRQEGGTHKALCPQRLGILPAF